MIITLRDFNDFKNKVSALDLAVTTAEYNGVMTGIATNGAVTFILPLPNQTAEEIFFTDFPSDTKLIQNTIVEPFATKGDNHFRGTGVEQLVKAGEVGDIDLTVVYNTARYNGIEILNGDYGDEVTLRILDDENGTYSGTPNAVLDTFGINWKMKKELVQILPYEATLYKGMTICVQYNNNQAVDKTIYVNHYLHEVL